MAKSKTKSSDNVMAMLPHLLGIFTGFLGPLIFYFVNKDQGDKIALENSKHALNFQLSLIIYWVVTFVLMFILIGFVIAAVLGIFSLIVMIIASIRSYEGEVYQYPLEIPFIK